MPLCASSNNNPAWGRRKPSNSATKHGQLLKAGDKPLATSPKFAKPKEKNWQTSFRKPGCSRTNRIKGQRKAKGNKPSNSPSPARTKTKMRQNPVLWRQGVQPVPAPPIFLFVSRCRTPAGEVWRSCLLTCFRKSQSPAPRAKATRQRQSAKTAWGPPARLMRMLHSADAPLSQRAVHGLELLLLFQHAQTVLEAEHHVTR